MTLKSQIEEQLIDLRLVIAIAEEYGTPDFASQMGMRSLKKREAELRQELEGLKGEIE